MKKIYKILLISILLTFLISCNRDKWKKTSIVFNQADKTLYVTTVKDKRYLHFHPNLSLEEKDYIELDVSLVPSDGDEIGVCYNKKGYEWIMYNYKAELTESYIDTSKYLYLSSLPINAINNRKDLSVFFDDNCAMIMIREAFIRTKNLGNYSVEYR